jgi:UDP-N-acetylglucosamine 2-epimerase
MTSLDAVIRELQEQRNRIDRALQALLGVRSGTFTKRVQTKAPSPATQRKMRAARPRRLSAAARARIAAAQRKRWAKVRAQKVKKA